MTSISELVKRLDAAYEIEHSDLFREAARALESLEAEREMLIRNRDMWKGQSERQAATLHDLRISWADADRRVEEEREWAESEASRYAAFYPEGSDGRNTFVIFADAIRARSNGEQVTGGEDNGVTARSTASSPIEQEGSIEAAPLSEGGK